MKYSVQIARYDNSYYENIEDRNDAFNAAVMAFRAFYNLSVDEKYIDYEHFYGYNKNEAGEITQWFYYNGSNSFIINKYNYNL